MNGTEAPTRANVMMQKRVAILIGLLACGAPAGPAAAQEIYRWTDEDGVVHFSDTAPGAKSGTVSTVTIEDTRSSDYDPEADLYNVAAQAERMQALRDEMQKKRDAREDRQRSAPPPQPVQATRSVGYGLPPWWWDRPDHGRPPKPELPIEPPPERPPTSTLVPPGAIRD